MKRKGISLIVLMITIIVILILAAIILSMTKANSIKNAKKAVSENDVKVAQEAVTMWISNRWISEENIGEEVWGYLFGNGYKRFIDYRSKCRWKYNKYSSYVRGARIKYVGRISIRKKSSKKDKEKW